MEFKDRVFHIALFIIFLAVLKSNVNFGNAEISKQGVLFQNTIGGLFCLFNWHVTNLFITGTFLLHTENC